MNASVPSAGRLVRSTALALLLAAALLFTVILPAEYGTDPTGIGGVLGLTALGNAKRSAANQPVVDVQHVHQRKYHSANVTIALRPRGDLEYKATLAAGEPLLYSWRVEGGPVYFEFHGEPTEGDWPAGYYRSYEIQDGSSAAHGSFIAPFTGQHGWYWRNLSDRPATITLQASGYYSRLGRIESGRAAVE